MLPLVSIIVPVYNVEKYLRECLNSLVTQTYPNLEILLIDDGSKDSSGKICDEYAHAHKNFYAYHKKNTGLGLTRNYGLNLIKGDYVTAGVGTILEAKRNNKTVIVVPRLKKYNEHVDDHQQQIAYGFSKKEIVLESDCSNLKSVLDKAQEIRLKEYKFNNKVFIHKLNDILDSME